MRELYDTLPEKPEWLTKEAIDDYAERMAPPYQVVAYHHFENGFDDKLDYQTLAEAETAAQGYVDGTMESDGFAYDGAAIYDRQTRKYLRIYGNYPDERAHAETAGRDLVEEPAVSTESTIAPADRFHVVSLDQGFYIRYAMGIGNFFGMLPEQMQGSRLYGVELDSITGRIAKQLYPKANITIAGFETTDRRDFFDLAVGNVPFGQYKVNDPAYNKLTQLVFCDVSTPQAAVKAKATALDPHSGIAKPFTVYADIRSKLIAQGVPPEQIAFIHDANSEAKKKELFGKVRSGQIRVLLGSTAKMGAGTNVQDRLVAIHDLDCPWRPGDLAQRKGRIERQGNQNEKVHVFRYVTEGTFDAYLWQTVENKQKFISQIMSSKNPVRSCEDVDEVALSFAEIKALCAGDPRIKERMDLDVDVARLKIMKADYKTRQFRLEDSLIRSFPAEIAKMKEQMESLKADMQTLSAHPHPDGGFAGMTVLTDNLLERENAGAALIEAAKQATGLDPVEIGSYRGFAMSVTLENFGKKFVLTMQGKLRYQAELGSDPKGNSVPNCQQHCCAPRSNGSGHILPKERDHSFGHCISCQPNGAADVRSVDSRRTTRHLSFLQIHLIPAPASSWHRGFSYKGGNSWQPHGSCPYTLARDVLPEPQSPQL